MYDFGTTMLLGLAVFTAVQAVGRLVPIVRQNDVLATLVLAVATIVALDYSLFAAYGIEIGNAELGTWITGVIVAGTVSIWQAAFAYLTGRSTSGSDSTSSRPRIAA